MEKITPAQTEPLKIVVINTSKTTRPYDAEFSDHQNTRSSTLRIGLLQAGYDIIASLPGDMYLIERIAQLDPDLIIIDAESDARDVLEHLVIISQHAPRPIVLFTEDDEPVHMRRALEAGVSAYVVAGLQSERVKPVLEVAMARFELDQQVRSELQDTRNRLAERKLIDKAKGILMQRYSLSEDVAYQRMRKQAMEKNLRLGELAKRILDAVDLIG
ncbi:ANTAR domain-containing response regulator [Undibacterium rugosum]|uniref:ANTAR domain-containing protein n=1 Tax=Undibacterium rugosum TaxID=2762291 RepID=A0A923I0S2_9BURK|nr:ANTAR domain-containing protein [Undibacterium rugosum]MBC3935551.1 ANTAR domain-containing protein [Undibacterium rugosum]MBR7778948.1 ANTAR domain-containing protein [Undibacterium rugosum]